VSNRRLEDLLSINWMDGLLVGSTHLLHSDRRVDSLLGEACGALLDQPGLIGDDSGGRTPNQLIEIESQTAGDNEISLSLHITRGFQAFSPGGGLIFGIPNAQTRFGVPAASIRASVQTRSGDADFVVCARQDIRDDLKIETKTGDNDEVIELSYPGLAIDIVEVSDYKSRVTQDLSDSVAIGSLGQTGGEVVVDSEYVPPVVRLETVASFDDGLVASLITLLTDLYRLSYELVQTSGAASAQGQIGADLLNRRSDYETLRTFLMAQLGTIKGLGRISPTRFLRDIVIPVATWWRQYYDQQFKQTSGEGSPVKRLFNQANALTELTPGDLSAGTGEFLRDTRKFIEGVAHEIGLIG
jgi:hypothetical protein